MDEEAGGKRWESSQHSRVRSSRSPHRCPRSPVAVRHGDVGIPVGARAFAYRPRAVALEWNSAAGICAGYWSGQVPWMRTPRPVRRSSLSYCDYMREPPFVIPVPDDRHFVDDCCANCLEPLPDDVEGLFCSSWCAEISARVRYMRRVFRDGRIRNPEVQFAVWVGDDFLLAGGYAALGRSLQPALRSQVKVRDGGRCRQCGNGGSEIDHVSGSSADLQNLQLLCGACHRAKTADSMQPANEHQSQLLRALFLSRVVPDAPTLLGDAEVEWESCWRSLKAARMQRFLDRLSPDFDYAGLKTRAKIKLAHEEFVEEMKSFVPWIDDNDDDSFLA